MLSGTLPVSVLWQHIREKHVPGGSVILAYSFSPFGPWLLMATRKEGDRRGQRAGRMVCPSMTYFFQLGPTSQQSIQLWVHQWINPLMNVGCSGSTPPTQHYYRTKLSNIGLGGDFVGVMNILILETCDTIYFLKYKFEPGVLLAESSCPDCLLPNNPPPVPK